MESGPIESVALCGLLVTSQAKRSDEDMVERRKRLRARRRRTFARRQSRERLMFVFIMSTALLTIHSPVVRSSWAKPRSNHWWEENFRMTNATFVYICNELRSSIEKK